MDIKIVGLLLVSAFTLFKTGDARMCYSWSTGMGEGNETLLECNVYTTENYWRLADRVFSDVPKTKSEKFKCFSIDIKITTQDEAETFKGCMYDNIDLCSLTVNKGLEKKACKMCNADKCNGSTQLAQSAMVLLLSVIAMYFVSIQ